MASSRKSTSRSTTAGKSSGGKDKSKARAGAAARAKTVTAKAPARPAPPASKSAVKPAAARGKAGTRPAAAGAARAAAGAARVPARSGPPAKPATKPGALGRGGAAVALVARGAVKSGKPGNVRVAGGKNGPAARDAVASKGAKTKGKLVAVRRATKPDPQVRPLGVLPPEARVRSERPMPARPAIAGKRPVAAPARTPQGAQRVTEKDLKEFEGRLLAERQRIMKEMGHLENTVLKVNQRDSSGDLSGYSFHMADAGTDAIEREKAFMFASAEGRMLLEINEALRRLYRGEYGLCESCGKPIARARLEVMPFARLCVECKEKEERANRGAQ